MPLVKSPTMTPRKLAANRANGRQSTGPRTYAGRYRVVLNALRHSRYSQGFRSNLLKPREDVALYDWIYARVPRQHTAGRQSVLGPWLMALGQVTRRQAKSARLCAFRRLRGL